MSSQIAPTAPHRSSPSLRAVDLRPIEAADRDEAARIVYEAFAGIHDHHRFARDFPTVDAATQLTTGFIAHPSIYGVVAEIDGPIVGSNFLDERGPVRGVGPITVDPAVQGHGVGRALMRAVLDRGAGAMGIRLLQDSFNTRSLSLYASLGFDVTEPVALRPSRMATAGEKPGSASSREPARHGRTDRRCARADRRVRLLPAPIHQAELFRWLLGEGLRVVKPMTYMTIGRYATPAGGWIPSVLY